MGKRAAQTSSAQQAKAAKLEKDPFTQELAPLLQHLEKAELSKSSVEMLQSVAPFCLTPTKDMHDFQRRMVVSIGEALQGVQSKREAAVAEAEKSLEELTVRQEQHAVQLKEAEAKAEMSQAQYETKAKVQGTVEAEAKETSQHVAQAKESEEELMREKAAVLKEHESFEKFLTTFNALKNGTFAGKEWRERNKAIDETLKVLSEVCDASLRASLPTALRTKPAERKRFSLKAVNFCEVALANRGEKLKETLAGFEQQAVERAQKCEEATQAFRLFKEKLSSAKAETATAKECFEHDLKQKIDIEEEIKGAPATLAQIHKSLEEAKGELSHSQGIVEKFQELKTRTTEPVKVDVTPVS